MSKPVKPPAVYPNYPSHQWSLIEDKTGAIYQTVYGRLVPNGPWGTWVFRTALNEKPQNMYFVADGSGRLVVDHKKLYLLYTDDRWQMFYIEVPGYIDPSDEPSSTIVNVNESQVASLKLSIDTAQAFAQKAQTTAIGAQSETIALKSTVTELKKQVEEHQRTITALQYQLSQVFTPQQIADLVWQNLLNLNYLYRLAFNTWPLPSPDTNIRDYVNDLVSLIKRVKP